MAAKHSERFLAECSFDTPELDFSLSLPERLVHEQEGPAHIAIRLDHIDEVVGLRCRDIAVGTFRRIRIVTCGVSIPVIRRDQHERFVANLLQPGHTFRRVVLGVEDEKENVFVHEVVVRLTVAVAPDIAQGLAGQVVIAASVKDGRMRFARA